MLTRWGPLLAAMLMVSFSTPASGFTFGLAGDGSSQSLTWFWELQQTAYSNCISSFPPCPYVFATAGRIPLQGVNIGTTFKTGGMLDWTASSGSLKTVALTTVSARPPGPGTWTNAWAAVDARATPLDFVVLGEVGDPFPLDLQLLIRPKLVGSVDHYSYQSFPSSDATLFVQMQMSVTVDGTVVSQDTLTREYTRANGQQETYALSFPKGGANGAVVHVTNGSLVRIMMWAYLRCTARGPAFVVPYSAYGEGPAIEIDIRDANTVAVEEEPAPAALSLAASPNPMKGSARIVYALPKAADVRVWIYDVGGHRIARLRDEGAPAGPGEVTWSGRSDDGKVVSAGIYLVELMAGAERRVQRLAVLGSR